MGLVPHHSTGNVLKKNKRQQPLQVPELRPRFPATPVVEAHDGAALLVAGAVRRAARCFAARPARQARMQHAALCITGVPGGSAGV